MACKHFARLSTGFALSVIANSPASENLTDGIKAYNAENLNQEHSIFSSHDAMGNPVAMYHLCMLNLSGQGIDRNEYMAFDYCKRAAEEGIVEAQFQLGLMYLNAVGILQEDDDKALEWFWKAAKSGHTQAKEMFDFVLNRDYTYGC